VVKVEMSRAERIEKELEEMRKNNRNFLPENENDNTEDDIALKGSFNSFLVERGRTLSVKKIVSFNNMSRGERIEKELEEMRENIRNSLPEDENESNEKDFPTNYSSNSFQVDENDINDQPNLNRPLPHISPPKDKILEKFYQDKVNSMENPVHIENIKDRQSGNKIPNWRGSFEGSHRMGEKYVENKDSSQCKTQDGFFFPKNVNLAMDIVYDLLNLENSYIPIVSVEKNCANFVRFSRERPILYRGTIADVQNGLRKYSTPATFEENFTHFQIFFSQNQCAVDFSIVYSTHLDPITIYKVGENDYFVWGIFPPYAGSLKEYKKYFDFIPRRIYTYEDNVDC